jgi:hypothetical protein
VARSVTYSTFYLSFHPPLKVPNFEVTPFAFRCAILLSLFSVLRVTMLTAVDGATGDMIIAPIVRQ